MAVKTYYKAGLQNVGSYQVAGVPWVTGSNLLTDEDRLQFPSVTKRVTVINRDPATTDIRVHFNATGSGNVITGNHFITVGQSGAGLKSIDLNVKCKEIYLSVSSSAGAYEVVAELTTIGNDMMYVLTGSGLTTVG